MAHYGTKNPPWARENTSMNQSGIGNLVGNMGTGGGGNMNQALMGQPGGMVQSSMLNMGGAGQMGSTGQMGGPNQMGSGGQFSSQAQPVGLVNQLQQMQAQSSFGGSMGMQMQQSGLGIPSTMSNQVQNITYPLPRPPGSMDQQPPPGQGGQQKQQRVFTGIVTKLHDNFGFVDEEVFFQTSIVKGVLPKVGDRVLVEATYNASMPFKWNAARIQVIPVNQNQKGGQQNQSGGASHGGGGGSSGRFGPPLGGGNKAAYNQVPPPLMSQSAQPGPTLGRSSITSGMSSSRRTEGGGGREGRRSSPASRTSTRKRSRSPRRRSRSKSPVRRASPAHSTTKKSRDTAPRYNVVVPKTSLNMSEATVVSLKARYGNMYIPSDFFHASSSWVKAFPPHRPFDLGEPCTFYIMSKEVPSEHTDCVLEPSDADHLYSAKVLLLSRPSFTSIYQQACPGPDYDGSDPSSYQHPTRLIQFLVGLKGKEPLPIGGPWSPSLDGNNPKDDPQVLINTAVRTTKALTGIDLTGCTQWYRFAEIHYYRPEEVHKGRTMPSRLETVVLFLPDIWSVFPSRLEWESQCGAYRKQLTARLKEEFGSHQDSQEEEPAATEETPKADPKHFSELDPKSMKVADLRVELCARGLTEKGIRSQLIARLTKAMKAEQQAEEQAEEKKDESDSVDLNASTQSVDESEDKKKEDEEKKQQYEKEKTRLEKLYALPSEPAIVVHPSSVAKAGKFDCAVMSLSVLLDYRPDDNKEHTFEVSLFAELFTEMLMRDAGFIIYKSLVAAPDLAKAEREEKERREKEKKEKKEKEEAEEAKKEKEVPAKNEDEDPPSKRRKEEDKDRRRRRSNERKDDSKKREKDDTKDDDDDDDTRSVTSQASSATRHQMVVKDRPLLLACNNFDLSHCGYILEKDMEDLLTSIGLGISRAQIKKLLLKVMTKDRFKYRVLTDALPEKANPTVAAASGDGGSTEEKMDTSEIPAVPTDEELSKGNLELLASLTKDGTTEEGEGQEGKGSEGSSNNLVVHQGAVIDINQLMLRLEKSEKLKRETDQKLADLEKELGTLTEKFSRSEKRYDETKQQLHDTQKSLKEQQQVLDKSSAEASRCRYTLISTQRSLLAAVDKIKQVVEIESSSKKDDSKREDSKREDSKREDAKKEDSKREDSKKEKEEVKKECSDTSKKDEVKKEVEVSPKKEEGKRDVKKEPVQNGQ